MKNKAKRIENTNNKFISRIKLWFQIEGRINNKTWKEYLENNRWLYQHRHNKLKHRSNMSNMEKHKTNKRIRQETSKAIMKELNNSSEIKYIKQNFVKLSIEGLVNKDSICVTDIIGD